ncbi:MAG TPA: cytochrome c biogenesis protein CcdA [Streptosporangiaceae bacterium]|nr:cytochrome c biogenesis protein CcdA [Streptosporangiaceae bacterium]
MTAGEPALHRPGRVWLAVGISVAVLLLAVAAAVRASPANLGPLVFVESISARISGLFLSLGTKAPFGYAFVAGAVASVNPCGFVLLPAYLGYYLGDERGVRGGLTRRAIAVSAAVTASFVLLFGLAGILANVAAAALTSSLPWVGTAVGVGLVLLAGVLASGRELSTGLGPRMAQHFRAATGNRSLAGYAAYGMAYGLASLGCTLPVFLGVVGTSFQLHGLADATGQFVLFGVGMGVVLALFTIATAWFGDGIIKRAQALRGRINWASATLLWLAGAYILYYWLTAIRLF